MDIIRGQNTPYSSWDFDLKIWFRARYNISPGYFKKRAPDQLFSNDIQISLAAMLDDTNKKKQLSSSNIAKMTSCQRREIICWIMLNKLIPLKYIFNSGLLLTALYL